MALWDELNEDLLLLQVSCASLAGPADGVNGPAKAFEISCGLCHTPNGFRPLAESFTDMSAEEIDEFLDESGDLVDEMPGYFGTPLQREMLIRFLQEMGAGEAAGEPATASVAVEERSRS